MSNTLGGTDIVGGMGYGGGFGGGIAPIGIIGLNTLLGDRDRGRGFDTPGINVLEQNVSNLIKDVADNGKEIHVLGNEVAGMFATQNLAFTGEFRNLDNQICEVEKEALKAAHANEVQGLRNTMAIQSQMTAFEVSNDKQFCEIKSLVMAEGDKTRDLITTNLIDDLRGKLADSTRNRDNREIEINVQNNAVQTQNQINAQFQNQNQAFANAIGLLSDQVNKATNSVVNLGTMVGSGQTATQSNTKVN